MLDFWNNVKEELEYKGISQKELANITKISYNTFQSWITKDRFPNAADSVKIEKVLGVSVEYLVTGSEKTLERTINPDLDSIFHDIKHLSNDDLKIAKMIVHRLNEVSNSSLKTETKY